MTMTIITKWPSLVYARLESKGLYSLDRENRTPVLSLCKPALYQLCSKLKWLIGLIIGTENVRTYNKNSRNSAPLSLFMQIETSFVLFKVALFCICRFLTFVSCYKLSFKPLHPSFDSFNFFLIPKLSINSLLITLKVRRKTESAVIKPVGEVFLPRTSGTLRASLCEHQQTC